MEASAALKTEAGISSETLLQFYQTTPRHMPEGHNFIVISTFLYIISKEWECMGMLHELSANALQL